MKPVFIFSILLLLAGNSFAQQLKTIFFKKNGTQVPTMDSAYYIRIISKPDSGSVLYNVSEFYKGGRQKLTGKSFKVNPLKFEGECLEFYQNGNKQRISFYSEDGKLTGQQTIFYPNGKTYIIRTYNGSDDDFLITANYDSLGKVFVQNGKGHYKAYDETFKQVDEEGAVKEGKRDGVWKGYSAVPHKANYTENYKDGHLINGKAVFDDGQITTYTTREVVPQFNGGLNAFSQYLSSSIHYPHDARKQNIQGKLVIDFVVDESGSVTSVKVVRTVCPSIDQEGVRVITESPKWIPGFQFGRPVRCAYTIPLAFALPE
ncbi:TonB family protein [Mucilaginibacter frigoritolerans]|uniref:TonB family protein n=1 Tax=Mucilaginibacter frigoritolerans TaxID=652788 RepID=A0A562U0T6_9SPHI|nr:energy transducer TonB [Mucilaginibacter frigoritolerans]TWI99459.1 TonB family protein [Mucilaginibacter frigoritolerans]